MKTGSSAEKAKQRRQYFCKKLFFESPVVTRAFVREGDYAGMRKQSLRDDKSGEFVGCVSIAL